jgi:ATP-dependent Clp protease ATP-binding subunit ClpC
MLNEIKARINDLGIEISFEQSVVDIIAKEGFDEAYGARPLRRAIVRMIEDSFSAEMLEGRIKSGDSITASAKDGKIVYSK